MKIKYLAVSIILVSWLEADSPFACTRDFCKDWAADAVLVASIVMIKRITVVIAVLFLVFILSSSCITLLVFYIRKPMKKAGNTVPKTQ